MPNPAWSTWICGKCRRHVPQQFPECRCGALRAAALGIVGPDAGDEGEDGPRLLPRLIGALVLGAALAGSWLWYSHEPGPVALPQGEAMAAAPPAPGSVVHMEPTAARPVVPPATPLATPLAAALPPGGWPRSEAAPPLPPAGWAVVPTPSPAPAEAAANAAPPAAVVSEADRARQAGLQRLRSEFASMRSNAIELVQMVASYEGSACRNKPDEECGAMLAHIFDAALLVSAAIERTEDIARTSWLDPGVVRDMRKEAGMDDPVWDRIERATREYRR